MTTFRTLAISFLILSIASLSVIVGISMSRSSVGFTFLPLALVLVLATGWTILSAIRGRRWALVAFMLASVIVMATSFRVKEGAAGTIDLVSVLKFSIYFSAFLIGSFALVRTHQSFLRPPGAYMVLYGLWAAATAFVSPIPVFTLGAVFGLFAWMVVAVAISEHFSEREILLVLLMSLAAYVVVSWFLYFAFPEIAISYDDFGGTARFTGVAGGPNQAGQMAALYLVVLFAYCVGGHGFTGKYAP